MSKEDIWSCFWHLFFKSLMKKIWFTGCLLLCILLNLYDMGVKSIWHPLIQDCYSTALAILAKIFVIRSFFAKNGCLLIFFACQKIINSLASKLASNFYTFDTCIIYIEKTSIICYHLSRDFKGNVRLLIYYESLKVSIILLKF